MKNQQQKIEAATKALNTYVEASKADDWTEELETAQGCALSAMRDAGYDWEADEQLMHYCLKATDEECAEATLLHFKRWVEEQQRDDEEPDLDHYCERKVILAKKAQHAYGQLKVVRFESLQDVERHLQAKWEEEGA